EVHLLYVRKLGGIPIGSKVLQIRLAELVAPARHTAAELHPQAAQQVYHVVAEHIFGLAEQQRESVVAASLAAKVHEILLRVEVVQEQVEIGAPAVVV